MMGVHTIPESQTVSELTRKNSVSSGRSLQEVMQTYWGCTFLVTGVSLRGDLSERLLRVCEWRGQHCLEEVLLTRAFGHYL